VKISRCIAAALLVASTSAAGCSSCAKDDAAPGPPPSDSTSMPLADRKAAPLPRFFERKNPRGVENLAPGLKAPVVADAGTDATTN